MLSWWIIDARKCKLTLVVARLQLLFFFYPFMIVPSFKHYYTTLRPVLLTGPAGRQTRAGRKANCRQAVLADSPGRPADRPGPAGRQSGQGRPGSPVQIASLKKRELFLDKGNLKIYYSSQGEQEKSGIYTIPCRGHVRPSPLP